MDIGSKIKKLRTDKGLSMYRVTQITGISGHHIKGIEEGTRQPTIIIYNARNIQSYLGNFLIEDNIQSLIFGTILLRRFLTIKCTKI